MPLEDVTTTHIGSEAGLSVGAVYRFFPDGQSIIDAIAVRHVLRFRNLVDEEVMRPLLQQLQNQENFDPSVVLDGMIDAYVVYLDAHPDFRTITFGRHISAATKAREGLPSTGLPAMLTTFMVERLRFRFTPELELMLNVASEAGKRPGCLRLGAAQSAMSSSPRRRRCWRDTCSLIRTPGFPTRGFNSKIHHLWLGGEQCAGRDSRVRNPLLYRQGII